MMKRVLGIVYTHENNALTCGTWDYCYALRERNYIAEVVDASRAEDVKKLDEWLRADEVEFCFGLQGVGSNLNRGDVNLWTHSQVPFIGLHYDNPCYNIYNHRNVSLYVANLYFSEYFLDIQNRYINSNQINGALPYQMTGFIHEPFIAFADRPIKLCYVKSGGQIDEYVEYFNSLPPVLGKDVWAALKECEINPNFNLCDLVDVILERHGYERTKYETQFWAVVQAMDYYLRRKRAIDFINWLKFQEGAVIIGDGWDFIDKANSKADFRPPIPADQVLWTMEHTQFFCNTNPYGRDLIHERVIGGLFKHCCVLSDTNAWWDAHFPHVKALTLFSWDRPLEEQLRSIIQNVPEAAIAASQGRYAIAKHFESSTNIDKIISYARKVRNEASAIPA